MPGKVEIVNIALARLGESPIQSLDEGTVPANMAKMLYMPARQAVLRDYNWNFALATSGLARLSTSVPDFRFAYALPADCLRAVRLAGGAPFVLRGNEVHTNMESPVLEYIRDVTDEAEFDSKFVEAFSYKLASDLAMSIKGSSELMASYANVYSALVQQAAAESAREMSAPLSDNPYLEARNGCR